MDTSASGSFAYIIEWDASEVLSNFTFSLTDDAGGRFAINSKHRRNHLHRHRLARL
jgi:hypothetical protein